jgi:hypothetical protein
MQSSENRPTFAVMSLVIDKKLIARGGKQDKGGERKVVVPPVDSDRHALVYRVAIRLDAQPPARHKQHQATLLRSIKNAVLTTRLAFFSPVCSRRYRNRIRVAPVCPPVATASPTTPRPGPSAIPHSQRQNTARARHWPSPCSPDIQKVAIDGGEHWCIYLSTQHAEEAVAECRN